MGSELNDVDNQSRPLDLSKDVNKRSRFIGFSKVFILSNPRITNELDKHWHVDDFKYQ